MTRFAALLLALAPAAADPEPPQMPEARFLSLAKAPSAEEAVRIAALLNAVPGVEKVDLRGEEAAVVFQGGAADGDRLVRVLREQGIEARAQVLDTWVLLLAEPPPPLTEAQRRSLVEDGLSGSEIEEAQMRVTAYVPRMTTGRLLSLLDACGVKARVQAESRTFAVVGPASDWDALRRLLSGVPGVTEVEPRPESSQVRLTREKGRAPLDRLNEALSPKGWKLEPAGP